jgi:hypothetical protein
VASVIVEISGVWVLLWQVYAELFNDASSERMDQLFRYLDKDDTGVVDFLSWSRRIRLQVTTHPSPVMCAAIALLCCLPCNPLRMSIIQHVFICSCCTGAFANLKDAVRRWVG